MEQVLHGPRNPGCDATSAGYAACVATDFFNFANPYAARDNARQGGADLLQLMLVAQQLQISAAIDPEHIVPTLDPGHIAFLGDSQGGITGAPFVAAEAQLTGAAFSSTGGLFTETILARQSPVDFKSQLETQLGIAGTESLDAFHPALALMQTFLDPGDPINYAKALQLAPLAAGPHDLLVLEGMQDAVVPLPSIEALAAAAQLPIGGTPLHQSPAFLAAQLGVLPLPVTGNVPLVGGARAGALLQLGGTSDDASVLFNDPVANCQVMKFLKSSLGGAGATIPTCAN